MHERLLGDQEYDVRILYEPSATNNHSSRVTFCHILQRTCKHRDASVPVSGCLGCASRFADGLNINAEGAPRLKGRLGGGNVPLPIYKRCKVEIILIDWYVREDFQLSNAFLQFLITKVNRKKSRSAIRQTQSRPRFR